MPSVFMEIPIAEKALYLLTRLPGSCFGSGRVPVGLFFIAYLIISFDDNRDNLSWLLITMTS